VPFLDINKKCSETIEHDMAQRILNKYVR